MYSDARCLSSDVMNIFLERQMLSTLQRQTSHSKVSIDSKRACTPVVTACKSKGREFQELRLCPGHASAAYLIAPTICINPVHHITIWGSGVQAVSVQKVI